MDAERREYLEMQLSAYLDGELSPQEQAEVEAWLAAEPDARRLLAQLRATAEAVHSLPRARASEELLGNLRIRLERRALLDAAPPAEPVRRASGGSWGRWAAIAAVIALTFTAGYFTWTLQEERSIGPQLALKLKEKEEERSHQPAVSEGTPLTSGRPSEPGRFTEEGRPAAPAKPEQLPPAVPSSVVEALGGPVPAEGSAAHGGETKAKGLVLAEPREADSSLELSPGNEDAASPAPRTEIGDASARFVWKYQGKDVSYSSPDGKRVVEGPETAGTSVLMMSFADADSRAGVIEALNRELRSGVARATGERFESADSDAAAREAGSLAGQVAAVTAQPSFEGSKSAETITKRREPLSPRDRALAPQASTRGAPVGGAIEGDSPIGRGVVRIDLIKGDRTSRVNIVKVDAADREAADRVVALLDERARTGGAIILSEPPQKKHADTARASAFRMATKEEGRTWEKLGQADLAPGRAADWTYRAGAARQRSGRAGADKPSATFESAEHPRIDSLAGRIQDTTADAADVLQSQPERRAQVAGVNVPGGDETPATVPSVARRAAQEELSTGLPLRSTTGGAKAASENVGFPGKQAQPAAPRAPAPGGELLADVEARASARHVAATSPADARAAGEAAARDALVVPGAVFGGYGGAGTYFDSPGSALASATQPGGAAAGLPADTNVLVVYLRVLSPDTGPAASTAPSSPTSEPTGEQPSSQPAGTRGP